jgi:hypothetical protein
MFASLPRVTAAWWRRQETSENLLAMFETLNLSHELPKNPTPPAKNQADPTFITSRGRRPDPLLSQAFSAAF